MKNKIILAVVAGCTLGLTACSVSDHTTAHARHKDVIIGNNTDFELTADNLTRGEVPAGQGGVTVIMNPKGTKILKTIYNDPLAGVVTASGVHVVVGRNQSEGLGKIAGMVNNFILGWVTNTATTATRDVNLAKEGTTRALSTDLTTRHATSVGGAIVHDPLLKVTQTPFAP